MSILALQTGVFVSAAVLTGLFLRLAQSLRLLDEPVARSSHQRPTPVGGGISIVLLFLLVSSWYFLIGALPFNEYMAVLATGVIGLLGFVDDFMPLDLKWRVPTQTFAALWVVFWLGEMPAVNFAGLMLAQPLLLKILAVLALLWLLNLYNFMDGIDGLAGSELVFVTLLSYLLLINSGDEVSVMLSATLLAAGAGFLLWNWPPARIFMGDVGSSFCGFSLGVLALISMQSGVLTLWTWLILLAVFIVDATVTLLRRFCRGEKWYEGHATHAYQQAARQYKSHAKVTITVIAINLLWLAPMAWLSVQRPELGMALTVLAMLPLLLLAWRLGAGKAAVLTVDQ